MIVQQTPELVLHILKQDAALNEWFKNEWVHLVVIHPVSGEFFYFSNESFINYLIQNKHGNIK